MADISTRLEQIIDKLDAWITTPIAHDYGLTIEERVDHISKQLDMIESGGSGGGKATFPKLYVVYDEEETTDNCYCFTDTVDSSTIEKKYTSC